MSYTKFGNRWFSFIQATNDIINNANGFKHNNYVKPSGIIDIGTLEVRDLDCRSFMYANKITFEENGKETGDITTASVQMSEFNTHVANKVNPHNATRSWFTKSTDSSGNTLATTDYADKGFLKMDNTPDSEKPVSNAMRTRIDAAWKLKYDLYNSKGSDISDQDTTNVATSGKVYDYGINRFNKLVLDKAYPKGTVFTNKQKIDPASYIGVGTWELLPAGKVIVDSSNGGGNTGGSETVTLTELNLPPHNHTISVSTAGGHTHGRGDMNITGYHAGNREGRSDKGIWHNNGVIRTEGSGYTGGKKGDNDGWNSWNLNAAANWSGETNKTGTHSHNVASMSSVGQAAPSPISIIQPWQAFYMWRRIS